MRILISGGTGMIGQQLVTLLIESGHECWVLTRNEPKSQNQRGLNTIRWDGSSLGGWVDIVSKVDAVINLAGENIGAKRWTARRKKLIIDSRVNSGKILTLAIAKSKKRPNVFIQASAIGYYEKNSSDVIDEGSSAGSDLLADICKQWEMSSSEVESMGIRRVIIRTGVVLSKDDGALNRMLLPFKFFVGGPIGNGKQIVSWIHQSDEISAIKFLLENEESSGVYNLTAPFPVSNGKFGKILATVTRRPYWIPVPAFILRILFGEMSSIILDGQDVIPKKMTDAGFSFDYEKIEDALFNLLA